MFLARTTSNYSILKTWFIQMRKCMQLCCRGGGCSSSLIRLFIIKSLTRCLSLSSPAPHWRGLEWWRARPGHTQAPLLGQRPPSPGKLVQCPQTDVVGGEGGGGRWCQSPGLRPPLFLWLMWDTDTHWRQSNPDGDMREITVITLRSVTSSNSRDVPGVVCPHSSS